MTQISSPHSFPRFPEQSIHSLDGTWDAAFLGNADPDVLNPTDICFTHRIAVPSAFDALPDWAGKRGVFAARTAFRQTPGTRGQLRLHGTGMWNRFCISDDGGATYQPVGDVALPYSGISLELPPAPDQDRILLVLSDNRFNTDRCPLQEEYFDFYAYAGIYRSVYVRETGDAWIERLAVIPRDVESGELDLTVTLGGLWGETEGTLFLNSSPAGKLTVEKGAATASCSVKIPGLAPWTPENPVLHLAELELDGQRIVERFGLRTLSTRGQDILLNGEPLQLRGFCRHEAHPQFGPALPHAQLVQDLQLLKSMGCNFVRGAHYPQDPRFLDLCDETGMLVFEESLGWNQQERHFASDSYVEACERQTRLMVRNSINHPSIFLWGFLNEGNSDHPSSDHLYPRLAAAIREEDDSRLVTYATNQPWEDRHFALADVLAVNLYPGWYAPSDGECRPLKDVRETLDKLEACVDANPDAKGKPLFMSEIGGGAIYGWHDPLRVHWSEEYQSDLLDTILRELGANPRYCGVALWQFCDGRTYANPKALSRPRAFNNKGVFDEYRRPKMAVQTVTRHWRS